MCLNRFGDEKHKKSVCILRYQRGFLLPLALFVWVAMSGMAAFMAKQLSLANTTSALGAFSTQAFYAADSGAQLGLYHLFSPQADRQTVDGRCAALSLNASFNGAGLHQCAYVVNCSCFYEDGAECNSERVDHYNGVSGIAHSVYHIASISSCGRQQYLSRRQLMVTAEQSDVAYATAVTVADYRGHDRILFWEQK
ncbi:MAG: hypothetical protein KTR20_13620 [Cellvibrionaceae bacterium]|nr:hypothetical protein [Cellvibrionaceae bacterium]